MKTYFGKTLSRNYLSLQFEQLVYLDTSSCSLNHPIDSNQF